MASPMKTGLSCDDFSMFQDTLRKMRRLDDTIVHALNSAIPSASFANKLDATDRCKNLFDDLHTAHDQRRFAIQKCVGEAAEVVTKLREEKQKDPDNIKKAQKLRTEQKKLQFLKSELNVEEIVQDQSNKVFYEKCRTFYLPPQKGL